MQKQWLLGVIFVLLNLGWMLAVGFLGSIGNSSAVLQQKKVVHAPFLDTHYQYILVLFGYVGCDTTCPIAMESMAQAYRSYLQANPASSLGLTFVSLQKNVEQQTVDLFARSFHPDFHGVSLAHEDFSPTIKSFGVTFSPSMVDDYVIHHTAFIYLVKKNNDGWELLATFLKYPPDMHLIFREVKKLG